MMTSKRPTSPIGSEVRNVTKWEGNSVRDMNGMKTNAPIIMRKTVAVAFIVCRMTILRA